MELHLLTLGDLTDLVNKRKVTSREVTEHYLSRIGSHDGKINSYVTVLHEEALEKAEERDASLSRGEQAGPLHGIPIGLKDIFCTGGVLTTCGSKVLSNFIPPYDSTVYRKLLDAGAVLLGKQNMDEFAMGSSTETSYWGPTRNPWDLSRIPGGSSGGSAAAVSSALCPAAVGTDTGGSIRQPASLCGTVGMKPTYGRVSRFGMIAFASSLDQAGPITRTVKDAAIVLEVISGYDPKDTTSVNVEVPPYREWCGRDIAGTRVGVPKEYFIEGMQKEVEEEVKKSIAALESLGCEIIEVSLPHTDYALSCYYIVAPAEASSNLARYDGVRYGYRAGGYADLIDMYRKTRAEGFGEEVKRRIMLGTYALSAGYYDAFYGKALKVRTLIKNDFIEAFKSVDVLVTPTSPTTAFQLGEKTQDPLTMYLSDVFTIPANLAGLPGISIPCGKDGKNLPVGVQIIGKHFREEELFPVASALESILGPPGVVDV
jgi:aspartyl-tRNA(Asn)/glutamyl-tRNA(Gln) amidotransferase subunit A